MLKERLKERRGLLGASRRRAGGGCGVVWAAGYHNFITKMNVEKIKSMKRVYKNESYCNRGMLLFQKTLIKLG